MLIKGNITPVAFFVAPVKKRAFLKWNVFNGYPKVMTSMDSAKRNLMKDFELY